MSDRKVQHYVPQFYLRKFSINKKSIDIYLIRLRKNIADASISSQCARDYFYGKNLKVETGLGKLETHFSFTISEFCRNGVSLSDELIYNLHLFITIQNARTAKMNDLLKESARFAMQSMVDLYVQKNNIELESKPRVCIKDIVNMVVAQSIIYAPLLRDLSIHKITNQTSVDFVTCDNPVVIVNPVFENNPESIGLGLSGIQIILVLSPKDAVLLYDSKYYKPLQTGKQGEAIIKEKSVISNINRMVVYNAYELIVKSKNTSKDYIESLFVSNDTGGLKTRQINEVTDIGNGKIRQRIGTIPQSMPKAFSKGYYIPKYKKCLAITNKCRRDIKLAAILDNFESAVRSGKYKASQFDDFLDDYGL